MKTTLTALTALFVVAALGAAAPVSAQWNVSFGASYGSGHYHCSQPAVTYAPSYYGYSSGYGYAPSCNTYYRPSYRSSHYGNSYYGNSYRRSSRYRGSYGRSYRSYGSRYRGGYSRRGCY